MTTENWHIELKTILENWLTDTKCNYVVISPDVDGLASAVILNQFHKVRIIGIYTTTHLLLLDKYTTSDARKALWLDHDISQDGIRCVGQHLVKHKNADQLPLRDTRSWNPNMWVGQSWEESFKGIAGKSRDKYPYGTTHFLWDLMYRSNEVSEKELALLAHADGTWFALDCYKSNAAIWKSLMFNESKWVDKLLNYRHEKTIHPYHLQLVEQLVEIGLSSQSRSSRARLLEENLRRLVGKQSLTISILKNPNEYLARIKAGLKLIANYLESNPEIGDAPGTFISGIREISYPNRIKNFDEFMIDEKIFSHAFTDLRSLSYTINIQL